MIDLHGAPGSQNGQDNSGLIGPVLFASNSSNADRSLDVLRNLTEEFSRDVYGETVTSIELLNEPRLDDDDFPMSQLKEFYTEGAEVVRSAGSGSISVTIHGKSRLMRSSTSHHNLLILFKMHSGDPPTGPPSHLSPTHQSHPQHPPSYSTHTNTTPSHLTQTSPAPRSSPASATSHSW